MTDNHDHLFEFLDRVAIASIPGIMAMVASGQHQLARPGMTAEQAIAADAYEIAARMLYERAFVRKKIISKMVKQKKEAEKEEGKE